MTIVLTKKFLDTSNLNLIKVENDVGLNRFVSSTIILFSFYGIMIEEEYTEFKSLEGNLPIRKIPPFDFLLERC